MWSTRYSHGNQSLWCSRLPRLQGNWSWRRHLVLSKQWKSYSFQLNSKTVNSIFAFTTLKIHIGKDRSIKGLKINLKKMLLFWELAASQEKAVFIWALSSALSNTWDFNLLMALDVMPRPEALNHSFLKERLIFSRDVSATCSLASHKRT